MTGVQTCALPIYFDSAWLNWMMTKYSWYKQFSCNENIEDLPFDEVDAILMIGARINECEEEMHIKNMPKK